MTDFEKYYSKLQSIETPIDFRNGNLFSNWKNKEIDSSFFYYNRLKLMDTSIFNKYFPMNYVCVGILGRIFDKEEFVSIVYRAGVEEEFPYLFTYSKSGEKIDSLIIYNGDGFSFFTEDHSYTFIDKEMNISLYDTVLYFKVDPNIEYINEQPLDTIESRVIKIEKYFINKQGRIKKTFELQDTLKEELKRKYGA